MPITLSSIKETAILDAQQERIFELLAYVCFVFVQVLSSQPTIWNCRVDLHLETALTLAVLTLLQI